MKVEIVGTGSDGNCFLFNDDLIVDMGLSYKRIDEVIDFKKVKVVLLTHIHGDHFNPSTIRKIVVKYYVKIICGEFLLNRLLELGVEQDRIIIVSQGKLYKLGKYQISPIIAYHDVDNFGYRIFKENYKHLHITDTNTLDGIEAKNYDSATIECNHEINKALELIEEAKENGEFTHLKGAINSHLSVQKVVEFIKQNHIKKLYPVHIGNSTKKEVIGVLKRL